MRLILNNRLNMRARIGWLCLLLSLAGYVSVLWYGNFVDESDNLVVGLLLSQGYSLYQDIFSHHFPFPYYWAAVIIEIFGKSILAIRFSVVLFVLTSLFIAMHLSRYYLTIGATSIIWSIIGYIYRSNMLMYGIFVGISSIVIFSIVLSIINKTIRHERIGLVLVGLYSSIALLSNPLSIYAITIAILYLSILSPYGRRGIIVVISMTPIFIIWMFSLYHNGRFDDFFNSAIAFNSQIYSKYVYANPSRIADFLKYLGTLLGMFEPRWLNINPMKPISILQYGEFDSWIFTGFLYRLSIVLTCVFLITRRKYSAAIFIYLFSAALLVINDGEFRGVGFIMVALVIAVGLVTDEWKVQLPVWSTPSILQLASRLVIGCMLAWLMARAVAHTVTNRNMLKYETNFGFYPPNANHIKVEIACNRSDVLLAYYPGEPMFYWFTDMKPVSRYIFMYPWVAEVAVPDVIESLKRNNSIVYVPDVKIWDRFDTQDYLRELLAFLHQNYVQLEDGWYVSPDLAQQCHR